MNTKEKIIDKQTLKELLEILKAIGSEKDIDALLEMILYKTRRFTQADAGTIYIVEKENEALPCLKFKLIQNDSKEISLPKFNLNISTESIVGTAALTKKPINIKDVYSPKETHAWKFDSRLDDSLKYKTKSILTVPMISHEDEVIGVIQLINKKKDFSKKLLNLKDFQEQVIPFDQENEELAMALASQAAICFENTLLYNEIQKIFEGFVNASVQAIEQRDPSTYGHSKRVCLLSLKLAEMINKTNQGPYKDCFFKKSDLKELEYAALLHDFGKLGIREHILTKEKKLFSWQLEIIKTRLSLLKKICELELLKKKLHLITLNQKNQKELNPKIKELEDLYQKDINKIEKIWQIVLKANEPTILPQETLDELKKISAQFYIDSGENKYQYLTEEEKEALMVKKGSLTPKELNEIRLHVIHTKKFLAKIPWGKNFCNITKIAESHHEFLNGSGYPQHLTADNIPIQAKIMAIADIFDALTASDRPYKKAVTIDKAIDILNMEAKDNHLDPELLGIFIKEKVWEKIKEEKK
jgi:HD-GYP domain-containing protein (c-di-GMP phosphodiesterase class II)